MWLLLIEHMLDLAPLHALTISSSRPIAPVL